MSLYLSEWFDGPSQFMDFCDYAWEPKIICSFKENNTKVVSTFVTVFNMDALYALVSVFNSDLSKKFISRLDLASKIILDKLQVQKFIEKNLNSVYIDSFCDINKTTENISELFSQYILDFEFWHSVDIIELYTNIIFYNTLYNPKPMIFLIPPQSEWGDSDTGWYDEDEF